MDNKIFTFLIMSFIFVSMVSAEGTLIIDEGFDTGKDTAIWGSDGTCIGTGIISCTGPDSPTKHLNYAPQNFTNLSVEIRLNTTLDALNPNSFIRLKENATRYYYSFVHPVSREISLRNYSNFNLETTTLGNEWKDEWKVYNVSWIAGNFSITMINDSGVEDAHLSVMDLNYSSTEGAVSFLGDWGDKKYFIDWIRIIEYENTAEDEDAPQGLCYQETANSSHANDGDCLLNYDGSYAFGTDGDFSVMYVNYTKPSNTILNATWRVKHTNNFGEYNVAIPSSCFAQENITLKFMSVHDGLAVPEISESHGHCYNDTGWTMITTNYSGNYEKKFGGVFPINLYDGDWDTNAIDAFTSYSDTGNDGVIYEEGIYWNITETIVNIDNCTSHTTQIYNFTIRDEENQGWLSPTTNNTQFDIELVLSSGNMTFNYNHSFSHLNPIGICVDNSIVNTFPFVKNLTASYSADDYVQEFYYQDNATSLAGLEQIDLHSLQTADSTSFLFNYFDVDGGTIDDIIVHTYRKYIGEGVFKEVERSKQNAEGDTIVHLVEEDAIYYFKITFYNRTLFTSGIYTALCDTTPCTIQLQEAGGFAEFGDDWDLVDEGAYAVSANSLSRTATLSFASASVTTFNLSVYRLESDGSYEQINSSTTTGTSGTINVTIPQSFGNVSFFGAVYQDGTYVKSHWIDFEEDAGIYFGNTLAILLGVLIIIALVLMAVTEGTASLVVLLVGVIIVGILGLIDYNNSQGVPILIYLILAGGIILFKLAQRNR